MLEDLVLRNITDVDFQLSFEEKTYSGNLQLEESNYFLLSKHYRKFKRTPGKKFIRFTYLTKITKEFVAEVEAPGYYEIEFGKNNNNVLIKQKKINEEILNNLISSYFGEEGQYTYDFNNSSLRKLFYQEEDEKCFMFPKRSKKKNEKFLDTTLFSETNTTNISSNASGITRKNYIHINEIEHNSNLPKYHSDQIKGNAKNYIDFTNQSRTKVYVRISSQNGVDNYLKEVERFSSLKWIRDVGVKFVMQIEKTNNARKGPIFKVYLGESYFLDSRNSLKNKKGEEVKLSGKKFEEYIHNKDKSNTEKEKKNKNVLVWLKNLKPIIFKNNSILEKFEKVTINNLTRQIISAKILNNDEDKLKSINPDTSHTFSKMKKGKHILEINIDYNSLNFYVRPGCSYTLDRDHRFISDNNKKEIEKINPNLLNSIKANFENSNQEDIDYEHGEKISSQYDYFKGIYPKYEKGNPFIDQDFPPNYNTLAALDKSGEKFNKTHFPHLPPKRASKNFKFIEPKNIFKNKTYYLYKDRIEANDVVQGELGNCYLMSIISAMAQRSDLILKAFRSEKVNHDGFYQIYFYDTDGQRKIMFVDHYFPFLMSEKSLVPLGARPNGEEIWVMILEKAYAKYEGGYANIDGGTILDELFWLTGSFCNELDIKSPHIWNNLSIVCHKKHIVCCKSNQGSGNHSNTSEKNIANSHAYSILGAQEYNGLRLLTLRNPWGDTEWKGDFSDDSPLWNDELKKQFEYDIAKGENGIFFIKIEDFCKEFNNIIICYC